MPERRYAILIGNRRYPDDPKLGDLRCPVNDVQGLHEILSSANYGKFTSTILLKNAPHNAVLRKLHELLDSVTREDLVLIYYSGHGKLNRNGRLHLATVDTVGRYLETTSIPLERLHRLIEGTRSRKVILILDCCYSGAAGKEFGNLKGSTVGEELQIVSQSQGLYILSAAAETQVTKEKEGDKFSLLTKHIIKGIREAGADDDDDGRVSVSELYGYVYRRIREEEGSQAPMKWELNVQGDDLIVAYTGKSPGYNTRSQDKLRLESLTIVNEQLRIIVLGLGDVIGAGLGLGLLRTLIACIIPGISIGLTFFYYSASGAVLGGSLALGFGLAEYKLLKRLREDNESTPSRRVLVRLERHPFWFVIAVGALLFGIGHTLLVIVNGILAVQPSIVTLLVCLAGFVAGTGLSAGTYAQQQDGRFLSIRKPLLGAGFAGAAFFLVQAFFIALQDKGVGITIAWGSEFYKRSFNHLDMAWWKAFMNSFPKWPEGLALLDAGLCGITLFIGISLGRRFASNLIDR